MTATTKLLIDEAAVLVDAWSWRLHQRAGVAAAAPSGERLDPAEARFPAPTWPASAWGWLRAPSPTRASAKTAARPAAALRPVRGPRSLVPVLAAGALLLGGASWSAYAWHEASRILALAPRMAARPVMSADGYVLGAVARPDGLATVTADGNRVARTTTPATVIPADLLKAARHLEGRGWLGVSPPNALRAAACTGALKAGVTDSALLRLNAGRCAGGSTLTEQAVRAVDDDRSRSPGRKLRHAAAAMGLAVRLDVAAEARLVAGSLYFGHAEGVPLFGVDDTARAVFGKSAANLELHESTYLAALLLHPARLACGNAPVETGRFRAQRRRALYALEAFADDPRYAEARAKLQAMAPIVAPAPDAEVLALGYGAAAACRAGASPLLRFDVLAGGARLTAQEELRGAAGNGPMRLTLHLAEQADLARAVPAALTTIAQQQRGHWRLDPTDKAVTFVLSTDAAGGIVSLYRRSWWPMDQDTEIGSIAKLLALAALAESGWGSRPFCNRAASRGGKPLHNAGGDTGVAACGAAGGRGWFQPEQVWGRSMNLPVYDALSQLDQQYLRRRLAAWGIRLGPHQDPAYQLAFGLARTTPRELTAFVSALSAGMAGGPPVGFRPHILAAAPGQPPASPSVDLTRAFAALGGGELIRRAGGAAYAGTLTALAPVAPGTLGKTGTLDDANGDVRFKGAVGGLAGGIWLTLVMPPHGALGDDAVSIVPLAKAVKEVAGSDDGSHGP